MSQTTKKNQKPIDIDIDVSDIENDPDVKQHIEDEKNRLSAKIKVDSSYKYKELTRLLKNNEQHYKDEILSIGPFTYQDNPVKFKQKEAYEKEMARIKGEIRQIKVEYYNYLQLVKDKT